MAVDNRPFKSKEQDGQGNEVIIRDQQLVEQGTTTTMPAGTYFQTLDVDGRPVKISKDNMLNLIVEGLGIIFNGQSDQQTVTKIPTLNGNNFGASTVATLASVLGAIGMFKSFLDKDPTFSVNSATENGLYGTNMGDTGYTNMVSVFVLSFSEENLPPYYAGIMHYQIMFPCNTDKPKFRYGQRNNGVIEWGVWTSF